ncbi:hypothetical protein [Nonomuraea sp. NPDC050643]|uniref:hypothetical protein n=1 Tax=Nonomuraea sp. NPDC050643 TaxID=3155660 RepID=UPI0033C98215
MYPPLPPFLQVEGESLYLPERLAGTGVGLIGSGGARARSCPTALDLADLGVGLALGEQAVDGGMLFPRCIPLAGQSSRVGTCWPSLVQPAPIRKLRDRTRYGRSLIEDHTPEMQRVEKPLEDAQVKLSSVISDIFGVSGQQMPQALVDGQRDPRVLAAARSLC